MANLSTGQGLPLADITPEERTRLLRYCARVTADLQAAEDLVQQTLLEAWQHAHRISTPDLRGPWLFGVARNVCLRWLRTQGRDTARQVYLAPLTDDVDLPGAAEPAAPDDPLADIERNDLVALLEQALALLPPATRAALVGRYIEDLSQAALADRLGVSEGAVEARLQRGKAALRTLLTTRFRDQLAAYGLDTPTDGGWEPTRIWCPRCGRHRLVARFPGAPGKIAFRCPGCDPDATVPRSEFSLANSQFAQLLGGLSQPRAVLRRVAAWIQPYFLQGLAIGQVACSNCGHPLPLHVEDPVISPKHEGPYRLLVVCPLCQEGASVSFAGLVELLPAVQRFWQQHGRIRTLPTYNIEAAGRAALVARFEAVTTGAQLRLVVARNPFRILFVEGDPAAQEDR
jgi:RNA polymerase sigma-70 factor (ECF subfamily)